MFELSDTSVAGAAEKTSDSIGVVTMIQMEPIAFSSGRISATDRTSAILGRKHHIIGSMFDAVLPAKGIVLMPFRIGLSPSFRGSSMASRVFVSGGSNRSYTARLASALQSIELGLVGTKLSNWFDRLTLRTPLHSIWLSRSWMRNIERLVLRIDAGFAGVKSAILFLLVPVKILKRLLDMAGVTGLFHSVNLLTMRQHYIMFSPLVKGVS